ncbi:unnamed protein product [Heterobilharzia americana]|nr:unnamed protein product [Heterobilharzia americana]
MEFDVFEKLSELETEIHILKKELEEKDAFIENLMDKNTELERRLLSIGHQNHLNEGSSPDAKAVVADGSDSLEPKICGTTIANMLKETSEAVVRNTGYTFDERTGLYYDHKSGYYYDPENQLFYEPKTGTYYKYNSETGEYTNYTASEDDCIKNKFKEFSHPVYAHLLKVSIYRVIGSSVEIQLYRKQSNPLERNKHLTFYLDPFTYILFCFHYFLLSEYNCCGREKNLDDYGRQSKTSRRSLSSSSDVGHRRRHWSRSHSGSRSGRSYCRHKHESSCRYDRPVHQYSRCRRKSLKRSHRSCSSRSDESRYERNKHRKRKHSRRHRRRSSSTTGSICSYKSRSTTHKKKKKRKRKSRRSRCSSITEKPCRMSTQKNDQYLIKRL